MSSSGMSHSSYEEIDSIAKSLLAKTSVHPLLGIICGTGLGGIANSLEQSYTIEYEDIPGFPVSTVSGHAGRLMFGYLHNRPCVCMQGRFHMYEGYTPYQLELPIRVMKLMGVQILFVTNAAGGLNPDYNVGDLMIIKDHIFMPGLSGNNPLVGANEDRFGPRFPALSMMYCEELRAIAKQAALLLGLEHVVREGVYAMNVGPSFESIAECKMLHMVGADVVGMSTCPEVVVAVHCGMQVFGLSMITNKCVMSYDDKRNANHEEVLETGNNRAKDIQTFVKKIVELIPPDMFN